MVEKNSKPKIFVIGSRGLLGAELVRVLSDRGYPVKGATHAQLDITKGMEVSVWMERLHPDVVVNCAALSNVDYCQDNPEEAFAVNAEGVKNICLPLSEDVKAKFIHISTDYVFDGKKGEPYTEADSVNPLSVYAESKLKGEEYAHKLLPDSITVRVQWLYGGQGKNFGSQMIRQISSSTQTKPYQLLTDRWGNPTSVKHVSLAIEGLIKSSFSGVLHYASQGACNWAEFGEEIYAYRGVNKNDRDYKTIQEEALHRPAPRPVRTPFSTDLFKKVTKMDVNSWKSQLHEVIDEVK